MKSVILALVQPPRRETVLLRNNMLVKASLNKGWMVVPSSAEKLESSDTISILALTKRSFRWKKVPQYIEQTPVNRINIWIYTRQTLNMNLSRRQSVLSVAGAAPASAAVDVSAASAASAELATASPVDLSATPSPAMSPAMWLAPWPPSNCCTSADSSNGSADSISIIALTSAYISKSGRSTYVVRFLAAYSPIRFF